MAPIPLSERIVFLDVLRGAALFGILAANMRAFNSPLPAYFDHTLMWTAPIDRITQTLIDFFISGKFITLFSFLFGIGFAVQMERSANKGVDPKTFYVRRLGVLLLFGLIHGFLIWSGDILAPYAVAGFVLFLLRKKTQRTVLIWAACTYFWPNVLAGLMLLAEFMGVGIPMPPRTTPAEIARIVQVYSSGMYPEILREHVHEMAFNVFGLIFFYPRVLALFLLGMWTYRAGIIQDLANRTGLLHQCRRWGLLVGVIGNGTMVAIAEILQPDPMAPSMTGLLWGLAGAIGIPAMSLFYASSLALAFQQDVWRKRLMPFGAVGRTALTNYLAQSVICTALYQSWGLGLFGQVSPLTGLLPTVVIFAGQIGISIWWVRRYRFGPVEWLWRRLTYGTLNTAAPAAAAGAHM
jgi:uncharacterized protein